MSRIGKRPVVLPKGVSADFSSDLLTLKGPKGELKFNVVTYASIEVKAGADSIAVTRRNEEREARTQQGLVRALIQNMADGVAKGYSKSLDVVGVGYRAELKGKTLVLNVGYSHPVEILMPLGINTTVDKQTRIVIDGPDKKLVGEMAACIRRVRPPEPYKGKGIRYTDEVVRKKVGKAAAGATAGG